MIPNILSIAGSDPSGGAGIQADIKAISANGGYAMAVITALTVQNTQGVQSVTGVDPQLVRDQIDAIFADIRVDAVKLGMLGSGPICEAVAAALQERECPIIVDPVLSSTSGRILTGSDALDSFRRCILPLATILTPNLPEAATLLGEQEAQTRDGMLKQACALDRLGPAVLIKGGHLPGAQCPDLLVSAQDETWFEADRLDLGQTHGTGCTLAAALATHLAHGASFAEAIEAAKTYTNHAISGGRHLCVGGGVGPTDHFFTLRD
ncbi:MAG: bifunctional hydroxymethylpyrimidine kinase/phosphomethylpyrimidine kinase [Pelagimonas sp.]|uniref:bifunctional hydroxymethylpyrimidine kinase/phosphomethylpyrimidine kinase n=1 Tax=Pelagimonas sp. TaxID=2073170 RepID=UPI003D6BCD28